MRIKTAWFICIGALIVALPVRVYQMLFLVDPVTGFFTDQNIIAICLTIFMTIVSAFIIFMCFHDKNAPKRFEQIRNIPTAIAAFIGGAGIIVHSIYALLIDNGKFDSSLSESATNAVNALESGQAYLNVIMAFVGVASGIIILFGAFNFATGKNIFRSIPAVAVIPPLWFCINLVMLFTNYTNVTHMTENIMDMFSIVFITLFILAQGNMFAKVHTVKAGKRIYAFGLPAVLYGFVSGLPSFVLQILDMPHTSSLKMTLNLAIFLLSIYALVYLLIYPKIPYYKEEPREEEEISYSNTEEEVLPEQDLAQQIEKPLTEQPPTEPPEKLSVESEFMLTWEQDADGEVENQPFEPEDDGREIPYLINRDPVFKLEKKERKKKKKKKRSMFYFLPIVKQYIDKKEEREKRPAWTPAQKEKDSAIKLENDWILDMYGYERRPKGSEESKADEPYFPKVIDTRNNGKEQNEPVDKIEEKENTE